MPSESIDNPIINSPFEEPRRHFRFDESGITETILQGRRLSAYRLAAIPGVKKKGQEQITFDIVEREQENRFVNELRNHVALWRKQDYTNPSPTRITRKLLEHWQNPDVRKNRFFFCQMEAIETAIYLAEVAPKHHPHVLQSIRDANKAYNPELPFRMAFKMATGSGKTLVMAMLIAWQALNKITYRNDKRFSDAFLIVTPGITIKDRLRVLLPNDTENYYTSAKGWNLIPDDLIQQLEQARVHIINYHQFQLKEKEKYKSSRLTKSMLKRGDENGVFTETPADMVRRIMQGLGSKKNIIVINDEAHHCYLPKPQKQKLKGEERRESEKDRERAALWLSGLAQVRQRNSINAVYDLSATPYFLQGSGYGEDTLFPWVVSDFSLVDAVECGIVKVPRLPISDNAQRGKLPMYRELWPFVKDFLPKPNQKKKTETGGPSLPKELEGALHSLYGDYKKYFQQWEEVSLTSEVELPPPVFIIVCNNTRVSKLVYEYVAGYEKPVVGAEGETVIVPGELPLFSNEVSGTWRNRPFTILIDSAQLESDDAMSTDFKKIAAPEIAQFKEDLYLRYPERRGKPITDEMLLREVMNTVGQPGKLGGHVRCVISVSMLTEGWDARTVTHILGVRAFGTQLLCEQVVGRGLRRRSYDSRVHTINVDGKSIELESFEPEYAEVYGVPFNMARVSGHSGPPTPVKLFHVKAMEDRTDCEITFPRVIGYRYEWPREQLHAKFDADSQIVLSPQDFATRTIVASILGENTEHKLDELMAKRKQEVAFYLTGFILHRYCPEHEKALQDKPWLFPDLLEIVKQWLQPKYVIRKDDTALGLLLVHEKAAEAAEHIYRGLVKATMGEKRLLPIIHPYSPSGSTRSVNFQTAKNVYSTSKTKCHVNYMVADTESWEQAAAEALESMPEVIRYVKNEGLGLTIPYVLKGQERRYYPDFIVHLDTGEPEPLNLVIEVSGKPTFEKPIKVSAAKEMWIPAVNQEGLWGKWEFIEIHDPWSLKTILKEEILP